MLCACGRGAAPAGGSGGGGGAGGVVGGGVPGAGAATASVAASIPASRQAEILALRMGGPLLQPSEPAAVLSLNSTYHGRPVEANWTNVGSSITLRRHGNIPYCHI